MAGDEGKTEKKNEGVSDHDSPYYLHPSDYPRQMHVNDVLTDGNYTDWSQEMQNFLFAKNKIGFVDGTIKKPEQGSSSHMAWMRCDAMIKGWLNTAMEKEIRTSVKYATTAREIWVDLRERFGKESAPRAYELKQSLTVTRQEGTSVSTYYTKLRTIWDEIQSVLPVPRCNCDGCTCGIGKKLTELRDKERLYEFLLGLDPEFGTIRTQILAMQPIPSLGAAYHLVADDEQQRAVSGTKRPTSDAAAFQAHVPIRRDKNQSQNRVKQKDGKRSGTEEIEHCTFCGKDGHNRDGCFKRIGYPEWWPGKGKQDSVKPKAACVEGEESPIPGLTNKQYQQFVSFFSKKDGVTEEEGAPVANMAGNKEGKWDLCSRTLIGVGECKGGLYKMGMTGSKRHAMMTSLGTWHKRLGHPSNSKLSHVNFLTNVALNSKDFCDSCVKAKFSRLPFPISFTKASAPFELLHCDVWGKYRTPSFTRASYFLTIVDDFSRAVWVFLLKHKHEASICLIYFHKMIQVQFEKNIKRIRCDNGGEFTSNRMLDFYAKEGILLETTCPHTPQQNGVVERKHRHLLETARALKFEANLPTRFWGECILTAAYVINRLPSDVIDNKTPYEVLYNQDPSYEHMRVFGCLAYYKSTETRGDKFEVRGRPGVFLGYPPGTKGYKVYDARHNKIIISRDVKFFENIFPFSNNTPEKEEIFIFPSKWEEVIQTNNDHIGPTTLQVDDQMENEVDPSPNFVQEGSTQGPDSFEPTESPQSANDDNFDQYESGFENTQQNGSNSENAELPRQKRSKVRPKHLDDYEVKLPPSIDHEHSASTQESSTVHPLAHFISYDKFTNAHKAFLAAITLNNEPKHYNQAVQDVKWREAMQREIKALEENNTWTLAELPKGKRAIDSKWVYKIKYKPNGEIERYKARLVAKGFTQMEGIDFHETFAPVAKLVTVRTLLTIAVKQGWHIHQLDVNNAFLHGDLHEDVYMKIPQGFAKPNDNRVCKLQKSLYGLKQASRNWYQKFTSSLLEKGFKQTGADHSLFVFKEKDVFIATLIYVDDVIIVGNDLNRIQETKGC
ncbi:putative RNA-directed DNA polymerase [Helianthus debilis subsp. tardiflorus]